MEMFVLALFMILLVVFVAQPLLGDEDRPSPNPDPTSRAQAAAELLRGKDRMVRELRDLEMDYQMGKLSRDDYLLLKATSERKALEVIHQLRR